MKLLLDQNLSRRLLPDLQAHFPGSNQVTLQGLDTASDAVIWQWAKDGAYIVMTKDADFIELAVIRGAPPKIIRLALGNTNNAVLRERLLAHLDVLAEFARSEDAVLELDLLGRPR